MTVDVALLRKCVDWATAESERPVDEREWKQATWRRKLYKDVPLRGVQGTELVQCGTAYCIAGYALEVSGYEWRDNDFVRVGDSSEFAGDAAKELLGIAQWEADALFAPRNTISDVHYYARMIAERAGEEL